MSLFLGPIHHWIYKKIIKTEELVMDIASGCDESIIQKLNQNRQAPVIGNLEEIIDTSNIHGWLSEQVDRVEERLAFVVSELIEEKKVSIDEIKKICFDNGKKVSQNITEDISCKELFMVLRDNLLDGMPCDGGLQVEIEEADQITWTVNMATHSKYWIIYGMDINVFLELRESWLQGVVDNLNLSCVLMGGSTFKIMEE